MKRLSPREHALAIVTLLVATAAGYGLLRYRPLSRAIAGAEAAATGAQERLASIEWPVGTRDPGGLERERIEVEASVREAEAKLAVLESGLAPPGDTALGLEVLALAERSGVAIRENVPFTPRDEDASGLAKCLFAGDPYARPLWRTTVEAPFGALARFLEELGRLERAVTILAFEIRVHETRTGRLRAVLVLAH